MISIIFDSNLLFSNGKDFTKLQFIDKLEEYVNKLKDKKLHRDVQVLIPQMVLDELLEQQVANYKEEINKIKKCKFPNSTFNEQKDYGEWLKLEFEIYFQSKAKFLNVEIISNPDNNVLGDIIKRAISKKSPFNGDNKKGSDKGFKDVIIWESILKRKTMFAEEPIIFITKDDRMHDSSLISEYFKKFNDEIYILKLDNSIIELYEKIGELLGKKILLTILEQVSQKLLKHCSRKNIEPLFLNKEFSDHEGRHICSYIEILDKNVIYTKDHLNKDKIKCRIQISFICKYYDDNYNCEKYSYSPDCNFDFEYSNVDKKFYLKEYDHYNVKVKIETDKFNLEEN